MHLTYKLEVLLHFPLANFAQSSSDLAKYRYFRLVSLEAPLGELGTVGLFIVYFFYVYLGV